MAKFSQAFRDLWREMGLGEKEIDALEHGGRSTSSGVVAADRGETDEEERFVIEGPEYRRDD